MNQDLLTAEQAYLAMYAFLNGHYHRSQAGDVGALLGAMQIRSNGMPMDPAFAGDWQEAVQNALAGKVDATIKV